MCSRLEGDTVEVGVQILAFELFDGPPGGGGIGDVVAPTSRHPGVKITDHLTLAIEDGRALVALGREWARLPVVVVDGGFNGLNAKLVEKVGPQAGQASNREVGGVTVLHADKAVLAVAAETVGNSQ